MRTMFPLVSLGLLLALGACGGDRDSDANREHDSDRPRAESNESGDANADGNGARDGDGGSDPVLGTYVDGPAGTPCGNDPIEFTADGRIMEGGEQFGTWRREGGTLTVTARGETKTVTETDDSLVVEGDAITRCR